MRLTKNLGMLLLGIWLIVTGLLAVVHIPIPDINRAPALACHRGGSPNSPRSESSSV